MTGMQLRYPERHCGGNGSQGIPRGIMDIRKLINSSTLTGIYSL